MLTKLLIYVEDDSLKGFAPIAERDRMSRIERCVRSARRRIGIVWRGIVNFSAARVFGKAPLMASDPLQTLIAQKAAEWRALGKERQDRLQGIDPATVTHEKVAIGAYWLFKHADELEALAASLASCALGVADSCRANARRGARRDRIARRRSSRGM